MNHDATHTDPVAKAIAMLELLDESTRASVLERMAPEMREKIQLRMESTPDGARPHAAFSEDIAARRQLLREASVNMSKRRTSDAEQRVTSYTGAPVPQDMSVEVPQSEGVSTEELLDPLFELKRLHPAAIARAMQGERAEAWALVLDRLEPAARHALEAYLDPAARTSIDRARARQNELRASSPGILNTVERAIARTVVPVAMREHHILLSTNHGVHYGAAV
jgi:hypothetical protein